MKLRTLEIISIIVLSLFIFCSCGGGQTDTEDGNFEEHPAGEHPAEEDSVGFDYDYLPEKSIEGDDDTDDKPDSIEGDDDTDDKPNSTDSSESP